ncbi:MAG: hypothetical protein ACRETZ_01755 [Steroidobacteraceae bacterium]
MTVRRAGYLTASFMAVALAGCATTPHGGLDHSAARLDRNAQAFAQDAQEAPRGYDESTGYAQDAQDFADRAHEFRRTIEKEGGDSGDTRASFHDLSRSYNALRDDVQHSDNPDTRRDLRPVTQAYLDVEDDMGGARGPSRYSNADEDAGPG